MRARLCFVRDSETYRDRAGSARRLDDIACHWHVHELHRAAFGLYEDLRFSRETFDSAWQWLCAAANKGYRNAQVELGHRHDRKYWINNGEARWLREEMGIQPDNCIAYMWYSLADSRGDLNAEDFRRSLTAKMTSEEITEAEQSARDWRPGDCPSAQLRLGPPDDS